MRFEPLGLPGAFLVHLDRLGDPRGWFARSFCAEEFAAAGAPFTVVQANVSRTAEAGTLRGMHLQVEPAPEAKLVRCTAGLVFDVLVDLRPGSPTFTEWRAVRLDPDGPQVLAPVGVAHGLLTLADDCELSYLMSTPYQPEGQRGVRWDDPAFGIAWPSPPAVVSERDAGFAPFSGSEGWLVPWGR